MMVAQWDIMVRFRNYGLTEGPIDGCSLEQTSQNRPMMSEGTSPLPPLPLCCGGERQTEEIPCIMSIYVCIET